MQLNLPIFDQLAPCRNILIAGMGGGFDIFCGLPIYFALLERGQQVHLANLTFSVTDDIQGATRLSPTLVGISTAARSPFLPLADLAATSDAPGAEALAGTELSIYFPELYLAHWFRKQRGEEITIWCFDKTGVEPLRENYRQLLSRLAIDGIILIDGGVDSLARGDEAEAGTFIEDAISLAAVAALDDVPVRLLGCLGLGAEQDMSYAHIFENIAALAASQSFLGACALTQQMREYQDYEAALLWVQSRPFQAPSVINSSVISAVQGRYGDYHLTERTQDSSLWISPLMALYWFFDLPAVAAHNPILAHIAPTTTFREAMRAAMIARRNMRQRPQSRFPLT